MPSWDEIASDREFLAQPREVKDRVRQAYFDAEVAPNVPADKIDAVRWSFLRDTDAVLGPPEVAAAPVAPPAAPGIPVDPQDGFQLPVESTPGAGFAPIAPDGWKEPASPVPSGRLGYMDPALAAGAEPEKPVAARVGRALLEPASALLHGGEPQDEANLAAKSLASGFATVGRGIGAGLERLGAEDLGKVAYDFWTARQKDWAPPPELQKDILDAPEMLADSRWWAANAPQVLGTMAPFMLPAVGGAAGAYKLAQAARMGARGAEIASMVGGNVASTASNALFEGALAYKAAEEAGADKEAAADIASKVARRNAVLTGVTSAAGLFNPLVKRMVTRAALSAALEGGQEVGEEYIPDQALHEAGLGPEPRVQGTPFVLGALGGAGAGAIIQEVAQVMQDSGMPPQVAHERAQAAVAQALEQGVAEPAVLMPEPPAAEEAPAPEPEIAPEPEAPVDPDVAAMEEVFREAYARTGGDPEAVETALAMAPEPEPEAVEAPPAEPAAEPPVAAGDLQEDAPADWDEAIAVLSQPTPEEVAAAPELLSERPVYEQPPADIAKRFGVDEAAAARLQAQAEEGIQAAMEATLDKESPTPAMDVIRKAGGINIENLKRAKEYGEAARIQSRGLLRKDGALRGWDHVAEVLHEAGLIGERDISQAISLLEDEARKGPKKGAKRMGTGAANKAQFAVRKPDLLPEETIRTLQAAGIKAGSEVETLRTVKDPVFGTLKKGEKVKVLGIDAERGQVLVEYGAPLLDGTLALHVVPVEALAEPVRNAPPPQGRGPAEIKADTLTATGVKRPDPEVVMRESQLLREKLRNQVAGARAAEKVMRHEIEQAFVQEKWEHATRRKVVELARMFLPPSERGNFMTRAADAKTPKDLVKAYQAIIERSNEINNKSKVKTIRILVERVMDSKTFPVGFKDKIREMLSDVRLENWSPKTIEALQFKQEWIDHLRSTGADVAIPQSLLDQLAKLEQRPLAQLSTDELDDIIVNLRQVIEQGKDFREVWLGVERQFRLEALERLVKGTKKPMVKPSTKEGAKRPFLGAALTWAQQRKNGWLRLLDFLQHAGIAITPAQVVVDDLDGTLMGGGVNRTLLWEPLQAGYISQQSAVAKANDLLADVLRKHGALDSEAQDRVTTVLMREQEGGREKLHQLGVTDEQIDAVKLNAAERATLEVLRGYLNDPKRVNALARVAAKLYNQEFKHVENYWPMMTDRDAPKEGLTSVEAILEQIDLRRKNVRKGMLIERKEGAKQKIRSDIYAVFLEAAQQGAALEHMAEPILRAHELVTDEAYLKAAGDAGQEFWRDYLDILARDGNVPSARRIWALDAMRKAMSTGALTFKPHVALVQFSSIPQGAALTGGKAMRRAIGAGPEWDAFVDENMPLVRERKGGDRAVREVLQGWLMNGLKEAGFKHIVQSDHFAAQKVGLAAYFQWCEIHGVEPDAAKPNPQGLQYAQSIVGRAMSSPWLIDMPLALSRGNITGNRSLDRALFQFQSEALARFAVVERQIFGQAKADPKEAARKLAYLGGAMLYEAGVRWAWRLGVYGVLLGLGAVSKEQYEKAVEKDDSYWKQFALSVIGTVPLVGAVGNHIMYDSSPMPVVDVAGDVLKGSANLVIGASEGKQMKATRGLVQALTAAATLAGIPGAGLTGWIVKQPLRGVRDKKAKKKSGGWAR